MKRGIDYCNFLGGRGQKKDSEGEVLHIFPMWKLASPSLVLRTANPNMDIGAMMPGKIYAYLSSNSVTRLPLGRKVKLFPLSEGCCEDQMVLSVQDAEGTA